MQAKIFAKYFTENGTKLSKFHKNSAESYLQEYTNQNVAL